MDVSAVTTTYSDQTTVKPFVLNAVVIATP